MIHSALLATALTAFCACSAPSPREAAAAQTQPPGPEPIAAAVALSETPSPPDKAKTDAAVPVEPVAAPKDLLPPPLPRETTVLHVGDSMADALGKSLNRELQQRGIHSYLEAKEATYIPEWAGFKMQLSSHLVRRNPDLVIVTLGGNETRMPDPTVRVAAIKKLVKKIGDRPCLWIAAPLWEGLNTTGILEVIRDNCAPCRFVDTNELIPDLERLGDKVHPTIPERRRWAKFMIRWLLTNRDPNGARPWDFKPELSAPPAGSEIWLDTR